MQTGQQIQARVLVAVDAGVRFVNNLEIIMPIKPENKARYPKNWKEIRAKILERADNKCEGSPDFPHCRVENYSKHIETGSKVVLTIAHLDHIPENCDENNLRAWCQRCHLNYDKHHHAKNAHATRRARLNMQDMFACV